MDHFIIGTVDRRTNLESLALRVNQFGTARQGVAGPPRLPPDWDGLHRRSPPRHLLVQALRTVVACANRLDEAAMTDDFLKALVGCEGVLDLCDGVAQIVSFVRARHHRNTCHVFL